MTTDPDGLRIVKDIELETDSETISQITFRMVILLCIAALCTLGVVIPVKLFPEALAAISTTFYHSPAQPGKTIIKNNLKPVVTAPIPGYTFTWEGEPPTDSAYIFVYTKDGFQLITSGEGSILSNTQNYVQSDGKIFEKTTFILNKVEGEK